jgi:hypothetical protein
MEDGGRDPWIPLYMYYFSILGIPIPYFDFFLLQNESFITLKKKLEINNK